MDINNRYIPYEALHNIFSYLKFIERIRIQSVCKTWLYSSFVHCGYFILNDSTRRSTHENDGADTKYFLLHGNEVGSNICEINDENTTNSSSVLMKRTKGHLPEPFVLNGSSTPFELVYYFSNRKDYSINVELKNDSTIYHMNHIQKYAYTYQKNAQRQIAFAIQFQHCLHIENTYQTKFITHLDLSTSHWGYREYGKNQFTLKGKNSAFVIDLTNLSQLERLSVRGCSKLHTLGIPNSLHALDAGGCTSLVKITTKFMDDCKVKRNYNLIALNLNGCRSLTYAFFLTNRFLCNAEELDLTSVTMLSKDLLETALKDAHCLKNISLRYIAVDKIIDALLPIARKDNRTGSLSHDQTQPSDSSSPKQNSSLMLVDLAFSHVTDDSVKKLVNNCTKLERCNLRGCKNVSSSCYNQVPIYLLERKCLVGKEIKDPNEYFSVKYDGNGKRRRKGDNIFYFVNS